MFDWTVCSIQLLYYLPQRDKAQGILVSTTAYAWSFLVAQMVKNPPELQEAWIWSLGWKDPLEKATATHSSILAWRIPWAEKPNKL